MIQGTCQVPVGTVPSSPVLIASWRQGFFFSPASTQPGRDSDPHPPPPGGTLLRLSPHHTLTPHVVFNPPTHSEIKANLNIDLKRKEKFCYFAMNLQVLKDSPPPPPHVFNSTKWQTCAWCSFPRPKKTADSTIWRQKMSDEFETKLISAKIPGFALLMTFLCVNA